MSPQRMKGKAQQRSGKLQELKDRREQAEKKRALDLTSKPATNIAASIAKEPGNQAVNSSPAKPISMGSLPRIRKVKGTSKAEKKAQEEAAAAAKKKREMKMADMEEGEIDSDGDEGMLTGRMSDNNPAQKHTPPTNKTTKAKPAANTTHRPQDRNKDQVKSRKNNNNNGARDVRSPQAGALNPEPDVKKSSVKRKFFDTDDDDSSSEEEMFKHIKKQKTVNARMDVENTGPSKKRKHVEEEGEAPRVPVKKQKVAKVNKSVKKPATAPVRRAPIVKETKYRIDTSKNIFNFGASKPSKKLSPKKSSVQSSDASVMLKDLSKKDTKTASSSTPSTGVLSEIQSLPAALTAEVSQNSASTTAPQPIQSPPPVFASISDRAESYRQGEPVAPSVETTTQPTPSCLESSAVATTEPCNSGSSSIAKSVSVAKEVVDNRKGSDELSSAPQSSSVKKVQGIEVNIKEELKQEKVEVPKQPKSLVEVTRSDVTAKNQPKAEIPRPEESAANIGPYVCPDGFIGLPPLYDATDAACVDDDSDDSDDEDTEMLQCSPPEVIIADDKPETKIPKNENVIMMDGYDAEIYRRHRVAPELSNVVVEEGSIDFEKLKAETIAARNELEILEEESRFEIVVSFNRADLLRDMGISKERITSYMKVNRKYEPHTGPWPATRAEIEMEIDSSDDESADGEEYYEECDKLKHFQGFQYKRFQFEPLDIPVTDPNVHPFGPI